MEKLKQTLYSSRNKNDEAEESTGATGKMTGPGSHFRSAKESVSLGTTAGSEQGAATDPSVSATTQGMRNAQYTAGPEAGGDEHVGTVAPSSSTATTQENPTSGAVGETSTYSSTPLAKGDPTSSVVDSESTDPRTYQKPEHAYTGASDTGVPEGAAAIAALKAFSNPPEVMPGSYPAQSRSQLDSASSGAAASAATTAAASQPAAPSTHTSTTSPGERLGEYREAEKSRGLDSAGTASQDQPQPTMVSKVLGAVGLGSLAGAGVAKATSGNDDTAVADTPDQPTTTTGVTSYIVPEESGPASHRRKESIPTTAYPAGVDSPAPVAPPVGGTLPREQPVESQRGQDKAAIGGAGAVGAGAYATHELGKDKDVQGGSTMPAASDVARTEPSSVTAPKITETAPTSTAAQPEAVSSTGLNTTRPTAAIQPENEEDHTRRNVAAAGAAGAGAGAAGAYAAHEYSQKQVEEEAAKRAAEQKELARQQTERQEELEKQQKEAEKAAAKKEKEHQKEVENHEKAAAKEEKKHRKELEKEEKKHQKELEKEEKQHQKEVAAAEKERQEREALERKRAEQAEEERRRREKEVATAAGVGATGAGAATYAGTRDPDEAKRTTTAETAKDTTQDGGEVEKKPSLLKRILKRTRKNKDTGEDEEYEEEGGEEGEEDNSHRRAAAAGVVGTGAADAGAYYATRDDDKPTTTTDSTGKSYEDASGGFQKPSYNPFSKQEDRTKSTTTGSGNQTETTVPVSHGADPHPALATDRAVESTPPTATERSADPTTTSTTTDPTTSTTGKPIEPITGLEYDPAKDPAAAKRIEEREHGAMDLIHEAQRIHEEKGEAGPGLTTGSHAGSHAGTGTKAGAFTHSGAGTGSMESEEHKKGLATRIKEKLLPTGGGVKEDEDKLTGEGYTLKHETA